MCGCARWVRAPLLGGRVRMRPRVPMRLRRGGLVAVRESRSRGAGFDAHRDSWASGFRVRAVGVRVRSGRSLGSWPVMLCGRAAHSPRPGVAGSLRTGRCVGAPGHLHAAPFAARRRGPTRQDTEAVNRTVCGGGRLWSTGAAPSRASGQGARRGRRRGELALPRPVFCPCVSRWTPAPSRAPQHAANESVSGAPRSRAESPRRRCGGAPDDTDAVAQGRFVIPAASAPPRAAPRRAPGCRRRRVRCRRT